MHRFFVPPEWIDGDKVTLLDSTAHQVARVLRMAPGDRIVVLDNTGWEHEVELKTLGGAVEGSVVDKRLAENEPATGVTLCQGLLKVAKFEWLLQKGTELGVRGFIPLACHRSVPRGDLATRHERWQRIIVEAAEQSGRGRLPVLHPITTFEQACQMVQDLTIMPWEGERRRGIRSALQTARELEVSDIAVFIGPEGGFSEEEAELAEKWGIVTVSLGRRILRAETAGLVAAAIVLYDMGDMGG